MTLNGLKHNFFCVCALTPPFQLFGCHSWLKTRLKQAEWVQIASKNIYPPKIKGKNKSILQGWKGLFFLEQIETLLQISPVPHRSHFSTFISDC